METAPQTHQYWLLNYQITRKLSEYKMNCVNIFIYSVSLVWGGERCTLYYGKGPNWNTSHFFRSWAVCEDYLPVIPLCSPNWWNTHCCPIAMSLHYNELYRCDHRVFCLQGLILRFPSQLLRRKTRLTLLVFLLQRWHICFGKAALFPLQFIINFGTSSALALNYSENE